MKDDILITLLSLLPKKTISRLVGFAAKSNFSKHLIPTYARQFNIDLQQAEKPLHEYQSLVDFFIRRLKPGLRPISSNEEDVISPVDGCVSQLGAIKNGALIQAKGVNFSVEDLLGGDKAKAQKYINGTFITIYLSPRDYHRIHTPYSGKVAEYTYIPGTLFPVNALGVRAVKGLFAKNERLVTYLKTAIGEIAVIKVGATIVGSVKVAYDPTAATNVKNGVISHKKIDGPSLAKGDELGYFEFGSTVILLFEPGKVDFDTNLKPGDIVKMGQRIAKGLRD